MESENWFIFFCKFLKNYFNKIVDSWSASHIRKAPLMSFSWKHFHGNLNVKMCIFYVHLFYFLVRHVHRSIVHVNYVLFWYEQFVHDFYEFSRHARFYVYYVPISYTPIWCTVLLCVQTKILLTWTFHTNLSKLFWHGARYCNWLDMQGTVTYLSWMLL